MQTNKQQQKENKQTERVDWKRITPDKFRETGTSFWVWTLGGLNHRNVGKQQKVELLFSAKGREKLKESGQDRSRGAVLGTKHGGVT